MDKAHQIKRHQLSLFLTILAVALWACSLTQARLTFGFHGIIHSYPFTYFIALGLLSVASFILWTSREDHCGLLCLQLCLFITFLWLTPILIGGNPIWADHVYREFGEGEYISQIGHLNPSDSNLWYHNWPYTYIIQSTFINFFPMINPDFIAKFGEYLMHLVLMLPLYAFFGNVIGKPNVRWAACFIFFLGDWSSELYFNPQGFSFFSMLVLLTLLVNPGFFKSGYSNLGYKIIYIILIFSLTTTHLLTSIFVLFCLIAILLFQKNKSFNLLFVAAVFLLAWTMLGATNMAERSLNTFFERALQIERLFTFYSRDPSLHVTASSIAAANIQLSVMAIVASIGIIGYLVSLRSRESSDNTVLFMIIAALFTLVFVFYDRVAGPIRTYIFALAPIAYYGVKLIKYKITRIVLYLLIMILIPMHIMAQYGDNSIYQYRADSEVASWHFIHDNAVPGYIIGGTDTFRYGYIRQYLRYVEWRDEKIVLGSNKPQYIHIGQVDYSFYEHNIIFYNPQLVEETKYRLENSQYYSLVYSNPDVSLYCYQEIK
jgi:hypothetical protein